MGIRNQIGSLLLKGAEAFGARDVATAITKDSAPIDAVNESSRHWQDIFFAGNEFTRTDSRAKQPYKQVSLVYTCVNELIKGIQSLSLVLSTIDDRIVESGPAYDLLFNSRQSWQHFVEMTIGHFALTHDVFWVFLDDQGNPVMGGVGSKDIKEILVVNGAQMRPILGPSPYSSTVVGWDFYGFYGEHAIFAPEEVHQWKGFNPYPEFFGKFHGLAPIVAAANDINYTFAAGLYNASTLVNGAEPGAILTTPGKLDPDQIRLIREQFDARHRGAGQAKRTALLTGGVDIKTIAMKLADLEVANITAMSDKKICSTFGVPPGIAGLITEAQYSQGPAMRQFILNTIIPLATAFAGQITSGIINRFTASKCFGENFPAIDKKQTKFYTGIKSVPSLRNRFYRESLNKAKGVQNKVFAWFDANQHPAIQEYIQDMAEKTLKLTTYGVPLNNLIETHDLPYQEVPWGEDWWIAMGQVPARFTLEAGAAGAADNSLPEGVTPGEEQPKTIPDISTVKSVESVAKEKDEQRKLRIWNAWKMSWAGIEKEYTNSLRILFINQQKQLIKKLHEAMPQNESGKSVESVAKSSNDDIIAHVVFDLKIEDGKVRVINEIYFRKASELGISQVFNEVIGLTGDKLNEAVEAAKHSTWLRGKLLTSTQKITGINSTTQKLVASQLQQGLEAGEGLPGLAGRIKDTLGGNLARAQSIARTSTAGAVGSGRHEGMKDAHVDKKGWLSSHDLKVRDAHKTADKKYADGIDVNLPFNVDGENLMFPGDPSGSAGNIINCRCVEIAIVAGGKSFGLDYYDKVKFYSYLDMTKNSVTSVAKES